MTRRHVRNGFSSRTGGANHKARKRKLIHDHAATVFEDVCRAAFPGARRYWEGDLELDLVAPDPEDPAGLLVAEVKWRRLTAVARVRIERDLEGMWSRCALHDRYPKVRFQVLDAGVLDG